jgi:hypothetical protein
MTAKIRVGLGLGGERLGTGAVFEGAGLESNPEVSVTKDCGASIEGSNSSSIEVHATGKFSAHLLGAGATVEVGVEGGIRWGAEYDQNHIALFVEPSFSTVAEASFDMGAWSQKKKIEMLKPTKFSGRGRLGYDWSKNKAIHDWTNTSNE